MISMARTLGAPLSVADGRAAQRVNSGYPLFGAAGDIRHNMHQMGVTFDYHVVPQTYASRLAILPHVIAAQVNQQ